MKLKVGLSLLVLLLPICLMAQSILSGRVIDSNRSPLPSVTVLLLNQTDSTLVAGTVANLEGCFNFQEVRAGRYLLSCSYVGFRQRYDSLVVVANREVQMGDILLEEASYALAAVTVLGEQAAVMTKPGVQRFNRSTGMLATNQTLLDVLGKLPGVIVQQDGEILLNGKQGIPVLMDERLIYLSGENLMSYLRSIPADAIEHIELITHPSSKMNASGGSGVIHIRKKRVGEKGVHSTLSSSLERGNYTRGNEHFSLLFRDKKWSFSTNYTYSFGKDGIELRVASDYLDPATSLPIGLQRNFVGDIKRDYKEHLLKLGVDYDFSDRLTGGEQQEALFLLKLYFTDGC